MIAVMNVPKMEVAPASAAAAAEGFPEHMGALSVGIDHGYGKVEDVREQHAKELQRDKKNDEAKAEATQFSHGICVLTKALRWSLPIPSRSRASPAARRPPSCRRRGCRSSAGSRRLVGRTPTRSRSL